MRVGWAQAHLVSRAQANMVVRVITLDVNNAARYYMPITSFKCPDTEALYRLIRVPRFEAFERIALRKLVQLDTAQRLEDLKVPPGNRLESLSGDRVGQWSIRINDRYRLCFVWMNGNAQEVEIVDYH